MSSLLPSSNANTTNNGNHASHPLTPPRSHSSISSLAVSSSPSFDFILSPSSTSSTASSSSYSHLLTPLPLALERVQSDGCCDALSSSSSFSSSSFPSRPLTRKLSATSKAFALAQSQFDKCQSDGRGGLDKDSNSDSAAAVPFHPDDGNISQLVKRRRRLCRRLLCCCCCCWDFAGTYESLSQQEEQEQDNAEEECVDDDEADDDDDEESSIKEKSEYDTSSSSSSSSSSSHRRRRRADHRRRHHRPVSLSRVRVKATGRRIMVICMLTMGAALAVPYQLFTTTLDYFDLLFGKSAHDSNSNSNSSNSNSTDEATFRYYFPLVNFSALLLGSIINTYHGGSWSLTTRLCLTNLSCVVLLLVIPLFLGPSLESRVLPAPLALALTYTIVCLSSLAVAINQSTLYAVAAIFGPTFTNALDVGKGYSCVLLVLVKILLKMYMSKDEYIPDEELPNFVRRETQVYFAVGCAIIGGAIGAYVVLLHVPVACDLLETFYGQTAGTRHVLAYSKGGNDVLPSSSSYLPSGSSSSSSSSSPSPSLSHLSALMRQPHLHGRALQVGSSVRVVHPTFHSGGIIGRSYSVQNYGSTRGGGGGGGGGGGSTTAQEQQEQEQHEHNLNNNPSLLRSHLVDELAPSIGVPALCSFLSFAVCVSAFPSLSLSLKSAGGSPDDDDWLRLKLVLSFCVADLLGKSMPLVAMPFTPRTVWIPALANTLALPLLFALRLRSEGLLLVPPSFSESPTTTAATTLLSSFLQSDALKCLSVAFLGGATGYGTTCANILAPMSVAPSYKPLAAECMAFCNIAGLFAGSAVGVAFCKLTSA